jgi:hypothetical protein
LYTLHTSRVLPSQGIATQLSIQAREFGYARTMTPWTVVEAARQASVELADGRGVQGAFRCLLQLLDDYRRVKNRDGSEAAGRLFERLATLAGDDPHTDLRTVFAWSYRGLTPAAARLFRLLGLHPGPDLSAAVAASQAATGID